jgi:hypothetical protein
MARYGLRKSGSNPESARRTLLWEKAFGVIVAFLILMLGVMLIGGGHDPIAHL